MQAHEHTCNAHTMHTIFPPPHVQAGFEQFRKTGVQDSPYRLGPQSLKVKALISRASVAKPSGQINIKGAQAIFQCS